MCIYSNRWSSNSVLYAKSAQTAEVLQAALQFVSEENFPAVGGPPDVSQVHTKVVVPYIEQLCKNIDVLATQLAK